MKKNIEQYLESFKNLNLDFLITIGYEASWLVLVFLSFFAYFSFLKSIAKKYIGEVPSSLAEITTQQAQSLSTGLKAFNTQLLVFSILLMLFVFLVYSVFRLLIWSKVLKEKVNIKDIAKYLVISLLNIAVFVLYFNLFMIPFLRNFQVNYLYLFLGILEAVGIILCFYFTTLANIIYTKTKKIKAFFKAFRIGVLEIKKIALPVVFIVLTFFVFNMIMNLIPINVVVFVIEFLIFIGFFAWSRFYLKQNVNWKKIVKKY